MATSIAIRGSRRPRGRSEFLTLDDIVLFGEGLAGGPDPAPGGRGRGRAKGGSAPAAPGAVSGAASAEGRLEVLRLHAAWGRAVGPHLKSVSNPVSCRGACLVVEVRDAAWKRELERAAPELLRRLARLLPGGPPQRISFRVKGAATQAAPAASSRIEEPSVARAGTAIDLAGDLIPTLESVADRPLRERLREVMGRYLARDRGL